MISITVDVKERTFAFFFLLHQYLLGRHWWTQTKKNHLQIGHFYMKVHIYPTEFEDFIV